MPRISEAMMAKRRRPQQQRPRFRLRRGGKFRSKVFLWGACSKRHTDLERSCPAVSTSRAPAD